MEGDDEKVLAAFERHDEFLRIQNALMSCDLAEEPSMEHDSMETKSLKVLNEIVCAVASVWTLNANSPF